MKLLIAVDSAISTEVLVGAVGVRPWPDGTTAHVLSVVVDADVPQEVWREDGYGKGAVRREMERRGEQITSLAVERLKEVGIPAEVVVTRGDPRHLIPFFARKWSSDLIFVRAHVRKDFAHWMLGSVARAVVTAAPCTVQIVRDQTRRSRAHSGQREKGAARHRRFGDFDGGGPSPRRTTLARRERVQNRERRRAVGDQTLQRSNEQAQEAVSSAEQVLASAGLKATGRCSPVTRKRSF